MQSWASEGRRPDSLGPSRASLPFLTHLCRAEGLCSYFRKRAQCWRELSTTCRPALPWEGRGQRDLDAQAGGRAAPARTGPRRGPGPWPSCGAALARVSCALFVATKTLAFSLSGLKYEKDRSCASEGTSDRSVEDSLQCDSARTFSVTVRPFEFILLPLPS